MSNKGIALFISVKTRFGIFRQVERGKKRNMPWSALNEFLIYKLSNVIRISFKIEMEIFDTALNTNFGRGFLVAKYY